METIISNTLVAVLYLPNRLFVGRRILSKLIITDHWYVNGNFLMRMHIPPPAVSLCFRWRNWIEFFFRNTLCAKILTIIYYVDVGKCSRIGSNWECELFAIRFTISCDRIPTAERIAIYKQSNGNIDLFRPWLRRIVFKTQSLSRSEHMFCNDNNNIYRGKYKVTQYIAIGCGVLVVRWCRATCCQTRSNILAWWFRRGVMTCPRVLFQRFDACFMFGDNLRFMLERQYCASNIFRMRCVGVCHCLWFICCCVIAVWESWAIPCLWCAQFVFPNTMQRDLGRQCEQSRYDTNPQP